MFINIIEPYYFFLALCVGLFITYSLSPTPEVVLVFPTPDNSDTIYKDDSDNCYKFASTQQKCPVDEKKIHQIPLNIK